MASNTQEEESMDCDICFESFDSETHHPMMLPCGHTYCRPCLKKLKTVGQLCPECKHHFDVEKLPKNFYVLKQIEKRCFQTNTKDLKTNLKKRLADLKEECVVQEERLAELKEECEELVAIMTDLDDAQCQKEGEKKGIKYLKKMEKNKQTHQNVSHDIKTAFDLDISRPRDYIKKIWKEVEAGKKFYAFHEIEGKLKYGKVVYNENVLSIFCLTIDEIPKEEESYCVAFNDLKRCASAAKDESLGLRFFPYLRLKNISKGEESSKLVVLAVHPLAPTNSTIRFTDLCSGELGQSLMGSQLSYNEHGLHNTFIYSLENPPAAPKTVYYNFSSNYRESVTANKGQWVLLDSDDKGFVVRQCQGVETFSKGFIGKLYKGLIDNFLALSEDEKRQTWNITHTFLGFRILSISK